MTPETMKAAIGMTIMHYELHGRPVKSIDLHPVNWAKFRSEYLHEFPEEEMNIDHFNELTIKDVTIKKGSHLMTSGMHVDFKVLVYDEQYKIEQKEKIEKLIDEHV